MSVNRPVELEWKGKKYSVLITMRDVDRFEQDANINLAKMAENVILGNAKKSHTANLVAKVLTLGGCPVSQEDVFYSLCDPDNALDFLVIDQWLTEILDACFIKLKKKQPETKKSRRNTRGKASIKQ